MTPGRPLSKRPRRWRRNQARPSVRPSARPLLERLAVVANFRVASPKSMAERRREISPPRRGRTQSAIALAARGFARPRPSGDPLEHSGWRERDKVCLCRPAGQSYFRRLCAVTKRTRTNRAREPTECGDGGGAERADSTQRARPMRAMSAVRKAHTPAIGAGKYCCSHAVCRSVRPSVRVSVCLKRTVMLVSNEFELGQLRDVDSTF